VTELSAKAAQLRLLREREHAQLAHDVSHVPRKDAADQAAALVRERDSDEAPVVGPALAPNETAPGKVADHDRDIAAAAQELPAEIALAEGPQVQERLQDPELADGQVGRPHQRIEPGGHRVGGAHELDVRVEGGFLLSAAAIVGGHALNLNRSLSLRREVVKAHRVLGGPGAIGSARPSTGEAC
jgi:hypothetical protein